MTESIYDMSTLSRFMNKQGIWKGMAWGIAANALIDGSVYFVKGNSVATGPSFAIIREQLPQGLKAYGLIMLVMACIIIYASARNSQKFARNTMLGVFSFSVWMTVLTVAGWIYSNQFSIGGLSKWFLILWLSLWLSATVPKSGGRDAT